MKKLLTKINLHSFIDVITNSSSEIFIQDIKKSKEEIEKIIEIVMKEMECSAVNLYVVNSYDNDTDEELEDVFDIFYDYECYQEPCKIIREKIKSYLGIQDENKD